MDILSPVIGRMEHLTHAELRALAKDSGVPFETLQKIRKGYIGNPGIRTVQKLYGHFFERASAR